jgi:hypothetical protein
MTTRLPQEVYEELGFTHEQFEKAMAMVQELGSNRAADRAMGLSSGTVARWARAWLLASRALEENPQADPREILAGLKLSRRSVLGSLPETGNTAAWHRLLQHPVLFLHRRQPVVRTGQARGRLKQAQLRSQILKFPPTQYLPPGRLDRCRWVVCLTD